MFRKFVALAALAAACGGSENPANLNVKTSSAVVASMSGHKTYAFEAIAPAPPGDAQWAGAPQVIAEVKQHIDADLQAKGYVLSTTPELVIRISVGVRKTTEDPHGTMQRLGEPEKEETVTDLAIDVFDHANGGQLFHGTASSQLHHREPGDNKVAKAVRLILEPVPPAAS
jgi:hypothetical protein